MTKEPEEWEKELEEVLGRRPVRFNAVSIDHKDWTDLVAFISQLLATEREAARREEREKAREDIIGLIILHSTGYDTVGGKRLWHVDIDELQAALTPTGEDN
jgi:hypothetical protein